ncbi:MAG TPA: PadR family transcriptional regulator [Sphingomicrobium sp.]|jgi:DNA-binding PadR family transcriptional regulator|nr:PadR family transcriptional regulator [Sphingomicrobium sp.]
MRYHHRCGPGAHLEFDIPDALFAMGRGPRGKWGPFEWDFGDRPGGRHGGPGRGRRRMFEGGELRLVLLKLIVDEPRHGYDLIRAVEDMTGGQYAPSPGVVYPTLTLLQDMGLIEEAPGEGPRKSFQATPEGRDHLAEREDEIEALFERLGELKPSAPPNGPSPVWRAMRNLGVAIRNRLGHGDVTDETVHELAALIDEFAQRVERLK